MTAGGFNGRVNTPFCNPNRCSIFIPPYPIAVHSHALVISKCESAVVHTGIGSVCGETLRRENCENHGHGHGQEAVGSGKHCSILSNDMDEGFELGGVRLGLSAFVVIRR